MPTGMQTSPNDRSSSQDFRTLGVALSNWGRWGSADRRGTLNLIDAEALTRAAALVSAGRVINLALPFDDNGPQGPYSERDNPVHVMTRTGAVDPIGNGYVYTDDRLVIDLQCGTQLDGLSHVGYDGRLYNGVALETVTDDGSSELGIQHLGGIQGRGVLLDLPHSLGLPRLQSDHVITVEELEACARRQDVEIRSGDILVIRTGWMRLFLDSRDGERYLDRAPGLSIDTASWLRERNIAMVASDNFGIEVVPAETPGDAFPLHCVLIRDMGMPLGEMLVLEELAAVCQELQRWEFLFTCLPLPVTGGVGSPIAPIATF